VIGVLTLEDVIERMLRIDINDEIDREEAVQAFKKRNC
jgi:CBS domain containing-hemolysin-like protein